LTLLCFSVAVFVQRFIFVLAATFICFFTLFFCISQGGACKYAMLFKRFLDPFQEPNGCFQGVLSHTSGGGSHFDCRVESKVMGVNFIGDQK